MCAAGRKLALLPGETILYWTSSFNRAPFKLPYRIFLSHLAPYHVTLSVRAHNFLLHTYLYYTPTKIIILLCESRVFSTNDDKNY